MTGECSRCGACCRVLPLPTAAMSSNYLRYLRLRGLKEEQGFILLPHDCQHLISSVEVKFENKRLMLIHLGDGKSKYECDIHESPERPMICRKFHGQKRIGRWNVYVPPGCSYNRISNLNNL